MDGPLQNRSLEVCCLCQNMSSAFSVHFYGVAKLRADLWAFSELKGRLVHVSDGWVHCQTEKGQSQTPLTSLQKYQLRYPLAEVDLHSQNTHRGSSLL